MAGVEGGLKVRTGGVLDGRSWLRGKGLRARSTNWVGWRVVRRTRESLSASMAFDGRVLVFPGWGDALMAEGLPSEVRDRHRREIIRFLKFCKDAHAPATVVLARQFLERATAQPAATREALR